MRVSRTVGTLGSLTVWWSPEDEWTYPHSVSPERTTSSSPPPACSSRVSIPTCGRIYWLSPDALEQSQVRQLKFNPTDNDFPEPYFVGMWEAAAGRNTGGIVLHDPQTGTFTGSGISLAGYHPNWFQTVPTFALFRFSPALLGTKLFVHVEDLGEPLPVPMYRTPTGLGGNWEAQLPEFRHL